MTYLQLVNAVLRRLREDQAGTVYESDYTQMIGDFVNDAKRQVEDSWDWGALRQDIDVLTIAGVNEYALTGTSNRTEILDVYCDTQDSIYKQDTLARINKFELQNPNFTAEPNSWAISRVDSNGNVVIKLSPTPESEEDLIVKTVNRSGDLVNDTDTVVVPSAPIIQYAYSFALRERGETGGQTASEQAAFAKQDLNNAIALDATMRPEETIWTTV